MGYPPFLPEELGVEILSRLPVKSLVRFRCVSKSWKSTISDSQFIKLHLNRSYSIRNVDFAHLRSLISLPLENRPAIIETKPSCLSDYGFVETFNGLICLRFVSEYDPELKHYVSRVRLWNPTTRSSSQPSPPLIFPTTCKCGFGYDSSTDTYKVVAVTFSRHRFSRDQERMVHVYNMGATCWRTIQVPLLPRMHHASGAVYVSNTLNWLVALTWDVIIYGNGELFNYDPYMIFSFDLGKENCAQLSLPYCSRRRDEFDDFEPSLGVLRGCLCICQTYKKIHFEIWHMKEFGVHESWTLLFYTANYGSITRNIHRWPCLTMYMSENGDILLLSKSIYHPYDEAQAVLYTHKDNELQVMNIAKDIADFYANNYIESLVSPY